MKYIYNPFLTGASFFSQSLLWETAVVGNSALLEQLLLRAGLPQAVVDDSDVWLQARAKAYLTALKEQGKTIFSDSITSDPDGTVKQLLSWRDSLVMAGWTADLPQNEQSNKLNLFAVCDNALRDYPARVDKWRELLLLLQKGKQILSITDKVEVRVPKELISPLIRDVLALLPNVSYTMEDLDNALIAEGHSCTIIQPREQYEAWQLLAQLPYDNHTMLVCSDKKRLDDTMSAIGGNQWQTDMVGCPHCTSSIFDFVDTPQSLIWLDCVGSGMRSNPYAFLSLPETKLLRNAGVAITDAETASAIESRWLYTVLNRIHNWILVSPKYHMGEALGEHPVITSLKQTDLYSMACADGQAIQLPHTESQRVIKLEPTGDISVERNLQVILQPSDSYSTIEKLVNTPLDYVLEKLGGLAAPEDDREPNENLLLGNVAHKIVELLVNDPNSNGARPMNHILDCFNTRYDEIFDEAMKQESESADFLNKQENLNLLSVFKDEAHDSIQELLGIISSNNLTPLRSEYEINTPFAPFANPHGFVDLLLQDANGQYVIIDLKWSYSKKTYSDYLKNGEAYQLYMYAHAVPAQRGGSVARYAYYLFPLHELLTAEAVIPPQWNEWLKKRQDRLTQLSDGIVAEASRDKYPKHLILKNKNMK